MPFESWLYGTFLPPGHAAAQERRYRPKPAHPSTPNAPARHPHWFCSQLRDILSPHPAAHRAVCDWLARLESEGHDFRS